MIKTKKKGQFIGRISRRSRFGDSHEVMSIEFEGEAAESFSHCVAGQFVQLACRDLNDKRDFTPMLRRPISLAGKRIYKDKTEIDLIFRIIGPGTKRLSELAVGHTIDVLGPLGSGFVVPKDTSRKSILIGGGIGLPPMFFLADMLEAAAMAKVGIGAARSVGMIEDAIVSDYDHNADKLAPGKRLAHFIRSNTNSIIATDDGSIGFHGNAIQALELFISNNPDWSKADIYCCGPDKMLAAAAKYAQSNSLNCYVCMEAYMSCGIGLCQSCAVAAKTSYVPGSGPHYKLVCVHGPVFNAADIIWE